jgi:hypothetical protein
VEFTRLSPLACQKKKETSRIVVGSLVGALAALQLISSLVIGIWAGKEKMIQLPLDGPALFRVNESEPELEDNLDEDVSTPSRTVLDFVIFLPSFSR